MIGTYLDHLANSLNKMECLELYNIWLPNYEVYGKGSKTQWRNDNLDHMTELGLIVEAEAPWKQEPYKFYTLTSLGEALVPVIKTRALATITKFRKRNAYRARKNELST